MIVNVSMVIMKLQTISFKYTSRRNDLMNIDVVGLNSSLRTNKRKYRALDQIYPTITNTSTSFRS